MMQKLPILLFIIFPVLLFAQAKDIPNYIVSGFISDAQTGEALKGVNVYSDSLSLGTTTNSFGFYSLNLPKGVREITFSYVGYSTQSENVVLLYANQKLNISLNPTTSVFEEVVLIEKSKLVESTQMSVINVPTAQIKTMPALLGEVDVLKSIQLLPGVQSGSEGSSGFYVRGGGADQNLILLDGVPVYNASHLFGFFSVFNVDAIKNIKLTKGGFPARFGGRLSSVLEIDMKEGNMKKFQGEASIGLISSKLTLESPIVKDKISFIISARRTYVDLLLNLFQGQTNDAVYGDGEAAGSKGHGTTGGYYFYDLNAKLNYKISSKDRIYLSGYFGDDIFDLNFTGTGQNELDAEVFDFGLGWGNQTASLRWNHLFSDNLFSNTTITYSRYAFNVDQAFASSENSFSFGYISGVEDLNAKIDFEFYPHSNHTIQFGASYTSHDFFPGRLSVSFENTDSLINSVIGQDTVFIFSEDIFAHDSYIYIQDEFSYGERLKINLGTHLASFYTRQKNYLRLQPRLSGRYLLNNKQSVKLSFAQMQQNLHLLTNSSIGLPTDIWVPATDSVKPQQSSQVAIGFNNLFDLKDFHFFLDGKYELSFEVYYKKMNHLIAYKEGASFWDTQGWESSVETEGEGRSYGLEIFMQKKSGKTTGWIGYTLSWTDRRFENINFGQWYPYKYDRRHDISIVLAHVFNDKIDIGCTWVYGTGNAITFPQATYEGLSSPFENNNMQNFEYFGGRNSSRMNPYHRLDFGVNFHKKKKYYDRTISLSVYNIYNRKNPFFIYLDDEESQTVARQVSLFPIIPTLTYNIKF